MDTKTQLLEAARVVVSTLGSRALTLDAVARQAGVSKGGLLYHYPTKKALIAGMVGQAVEAFDQALARADGDWLEAYVEATLADLRTDDPLAGVLTAVAEEPDLLAPFRAALDRWYSRAAMDYGTGALPLLLSLDALWFHTRIGTLPALDREALAETLRAQARNCQPTKGAR